MIQYEIALVIWVFSLLGIGFWQNHEGHIAERAKWDKAVQVQQAKVIDMQKDILAKQHEHEQNIAAIEGVYNGILKDQKAKSDKIIADMRASGHWLRDPYYTGDSGKVGFASTSSRGNGIPSGELSGKTSEFLLNLAAEADNVAEQLAACQQIVLDDRK